MTSLSDMEMYRRPSRVTRTPDGKYTLEYLDGQARQTSVMDPEFTTAIARELAPAVGPGAAEAISNLISWMANDIEKLSKQLDYMRRSDYSNYTEFGTRLAALEKQMKEEKELADERFDDLLRLLEGDDQ